MSSIRVNLTNNTICFTVADPSDAINTTNILTVKTGVEVELVNGLSYLVIVKKINLCSSRSSKFKASWVSKSAAGRSCDIKVLVDLIIDRFI